MTRKHTQIALRFGEPPNSFLLEKVSVHRARLLPLRQDNVHHAFSYLFNSSGPAAMLSLEMNFVSDTFGHTVYKLRHNVRRFEASALAV